MGNENNIKNDYYMCLNLIGDQMDQFLYCISGVSSESYAYQRPKKTSLYDYWDYLYNPVLDFYGQLAIAMNRLKHFKDTLNLNFRECLIVRVESIESIEIQNVLEKMNGLNREHYIPLMLFLCNKFEIDDLQKFKYNEEIYPKIDKRMVFFDKFEENIVDRDKMRRITYRLERFCSYHNELGDRFTIGSDENKNDYDLTEMNFPFTVNICCVGRFGKGKSTGVNYILGEKNAKENKSGTSATSKINYYQVSEFPVKIYDLPGFENLETVKNAVKQFKILNEEINQLQDQIHIFLYFIKSTDERMFSEMEYKIFKQILEHKDSFVIYVLTHSSEKTDKQELIDMINTGIKGVLNNKRKKKEKTTEKDEEKYLNIYLKMTATNDNCAFVNFHKTNKPIYGISDFFNKIVLFMERTEAYNNFIKNSCINEEEFQKKIVEEAKIRKIRAKALIKRNKIGSAIAGIFPGADYIANKFYIKKDAARKAGQIFGFDLKNLEASLKREKIKKEKNKKNNKNNNNKNDINNNDNSDDNNKDNDNNESMEGKKSKGEDLSISEDKTININEIEEENNNNNKDNKEENNEEKKEGKKDSKKQKKKQLDKKVKYGGYGSMYACNAVSYSISLPRFFLEIGGIGLMAVSAAFSVAGTAIGAGLGFYLMKRHCEELLDKYELLFIQNAKRLSDSLLFGINYLRNMSEYYKKQGY